MTEEAGRRVPSIEPVPSEASSTKHRRKRKWDQPAETLVSAGLALHNMSPLGNNLGPVVGMTLPGVAPAYTTPLNDPFISSNPMMPQAFSVPSVQQHAAAVVQKVNQTKIQDELIAREIVINDAETTVRYKLTKRQTQEEIQKCTGAVVITRGKYRLSNAPSNGEKPLYLHISAGAHLKETAERIKAVDRAAAMVEEMLKLGPNSQPSPTVLQALNSGVQVTQPLSTCVFLGFDTDPSLNIAARIRGPNDQYINHIMNETGATALLRGRGSGNPDPSHCDGPQPLHLFLSSNNSKSLEDARLLAENLLDTISTECGASRVSSCKVYGAVPPPQQLLTGAVNELKVNTTSAAGLTPPVSAAPAPPIPLPLITGGTRYSGYGGIYPQATPLQQVALVLRQSPPSVITPTLQSNVVPKTGFNSSFEKERRPLHRRKFQELPVSSNGSLKPQQNTLQGTKMEIPCEKSGLDVRNISNMPAPKKLVTSSADRMMPPPPPKNMPPPPPPTFTPKMPTVEALDNSISLKKSMSDSVPDTLIKLMEYGTDDDDTEEEISEEISKSSSTVSTGPKPFWAI